MSKINENYIEDYIREIIPESSKYLQVMEHYAEENHVPIIHPEVAQLLRVLIRIKRPRKILEIGTAIGYSAIVMGEVMGKDGKITTIEKREDMIRLAEKNFVGCGMSERIHIIHGDAHEVLSQIKDSFDLIFLDAAKSKYMDFLPYCVDNLSQGGIIISDNVLYKGMIANDDLVVRRQRTIVRRMREYLDYICNNPIFESSVIPIGDGVALTYKKED